MIPPEDDAEFVFHMEDVLALYHELYDPNRPVVCFDEHPTELIAEVHDPQPAEPGTVATHDYHYSRQGTKNLFLASEPLSGWRTVSVTDRRTTVDWVRFIKELVDKHYSEAECIRLVLDNLSTHKPSAFYEYCEPAEARRLLSKLEFHFTPVHGSWLNMAEIEFNALCVNVWTDGFRMGRHFARKLRPGSTEETRPTPTWSGSSPPPMPE